MASKPTFLTLPLGIRCGIYPHLSPKPVHVPTSHSLDGIPSHLSQETSLVRWRYGRDLLVRDWMEFIADMAGHVPRFAFQRHQAFDVGRLRSFVL